MRSSEPAESVANRFAALTRELSSERWHLLGALASERKVPPSAVARLTERDEATAEWLESSLTGGLLVDAGVMPAPFAVGGPRDERALTIAPEFRALALRHLARDGALDRVRKTSRALLGDRSLASFVTTLYSGELGAIERALPELRFRFAGDEGALFARHALWQAIASPFDAAWLEAAFRDSALTVAVRVLEDALFTLDPVEELYGWALAHAQSESGDDARRASRVLAQHALLRGETLTLRSLASRLTTPEQLAWGAAASVLEGEIDRAQTFLDESEAFRGRGPAVPAEDTPAILLALLAIQRGTAESLLLAKRLVRAGKSKPSDFVEGWPAAPTFATAGRAVRRLIQASADSDAEPARLDVHQLPSPAAAWEVLILGLTVHRGPSAPLSRSAWAHRLGAASRAWQLAGYAWFARQAFALTEALDAKAAAAVELPPRLQPNERAFAERFQPEPDWRKSLHALASFTEKTEQEDAAVSRRVTWFVNMASGELAKPALEDFVRGTGWTRGRRVELAELLAIEHALPPEDAAVVRAARAATDPHLAPLEALDALVGHPRVFNGARGRAPVDVVRGICRVETRAERGELVVQVEPAGATAGVHSVVVNEARLLVYRVSPVIGKLTALLPKNLRIPEAHMREALPILARLAEHVEVRNTALGAERRVIADSTPCLRIAPAAGAFWVELGVRPFGAQGRFFPPALGQASVAAYQGLDVVEAERDFAKEMQRARALIARTPTLAARIALEAEESGDDAVFSVTFGEEELFCLLVELREQAEPCSVEWKNGRPIGSRGRVTRSTLRGALRRIKGWYIVTGGVHIDAVTELSLSELATMPFTQSGRFIRLPTGDFVEIEQKLRRALALLAASVERGPGVPKRELRIPDAAFGALAPLLEDESGFAIDDSARQWTEALERAFATEYPLPPALRAELRSYQFEGYQWLRRSSALGLGVILADDMGLGKTLQVLALLLARATEGPAIVVAPTSVCRNWLDEVARFAPSLRALEYSGKDRRRLLDCFTPADGAAVASPQPRADVLIVSYALLQQHAEELAAIEWNTAVLDEAQFIKNESSLRAKAAFRLQARYRVAMTGTPVENHLGDLWSIFHFLNPTLLGSAKNFELRYLRPIEREQNCEQRAALKSLIAPFVLRRTKAQVLRELPPITVLRHEIRLSPDEATRYALLRKQIHEKLHTAWGKRQHKIQAFSEIMRLRRFCCHQRLVFPHAPDESSKIDALLELVEELRDNGHRALVFSQFVDFLGIVREQLDERRISYLYLDGATPKEARHSRVKAFQAGEASLFLISLKAGGFGLNLTAADYVIHLDPWWNPAVEAQATDRAHRIGQSRPVTVYRLITKDTIEERILELHREKRALADALLEGTDAAADFTAEDLQALLGAAE